MADGSGDSARARPWFPRLLCVGSVCVLVRRLRMHRRRYGRLERARMRRGMIACACRHLRQSSVVTVPAGLTSAVDGTELGRDADLHWQGNPSHLVGKVCSGRLATMVTSNLGFGHLRAASSLRGPEDEVSVLLPVKANAAERAVMARQAAGTKGTRRRSIGRTAR